MLEGFIQLLAAAPSVNTVIPALQMYLYALGRGYLLPALVIHRYGGTQDYEYDGPVDQREDNVQIDVYGTTPDQCQGAAEAVRAVLVGYTGTLASGTVVYACYLERSIDMPFVPNADTKMSYRSLLGFRVVSKRV